MKRSVTVNVNEEKLSAIEMYLEQKSTTLAAELDKYIEQLYSKVVPQNAKWRQRFHIEPPDGC